MKEPQYIYILLADGDGDGTMRSQDTPFGVAVDSEEEALKYVAEGGVGFTHSFVKVEVFSGKNEALKSAFPGHDFKCI